VAVVVAGLAQRHVEVERALADVGDGKSGPPTWQAGRPLAADPWIGAALTGLALMAPRTPYEVFGRWLRSPFFGLMAATENTGRALLDAELRTELRSQLPFATAYADAGLRELLLARVPATAKALASAKAQIGSLVRATPSRWARVWQRVLTQLGWALPQTSAHERTLLGWNAALDDFARLTPLTGEIAIESALLELERIVDRPAAAALPLHGIHVLSRIEEVGPGYEAAWVTGFTDTHWPEPPRGNPLLPRGLQRAHRMPRSSPQDARDRSALSLDRLVRRVPDLVISWPARVYDFETEPSPAIRRWPQITRQEIDAALGSRPDRAQIPARETVADLAPPLLGSVLRGGTGVLGRQARCPLRAFCEDRLGARALEPLIFGLPPRLRGIAAHHAAELLLAELPSQAQLSAHGTARIAASVQSALAEAFRAAQGPLRALFDLEAERLTAVLTELLARDAARAPFQVIGVEQRQEAHIGAWTLRLRLDRLDQLSDGSVAIIDYKTGERASGADWLKPRLADAQVPLYATQSAAPVGAAVIARLRGTDTRYTGFAQSDDFHGQARKLPDGRDWGEQIELWRAQLEDLVAEFAAGDTRVFLADLTDAQDAFAPLTRIAEQLALVRRPMPPC
jgi:probable DNA repair protein